MLPYNIIRNIRGSWPQWYADLDDGDTVYIRIRHGEVWIGQSDSEHEAYRRSKPVKTDDDKYMGVSDVVDALIELKENGYYYVCPAD